MSSEVSDPLTIYEIVVCRVEYKAQEGRRVEGSVTKLLSTESEYFVAL